MPGVVGETYQVALGKLSNAGFTNVNKRFTVSNPQLANGTVASQNPNAGAHVPPTRRSPSAW